MSLKWNTDFNNHDLFFYNLSSLIKDLIKSLRERNFQNAYDLSHQVKEFMICRNMNNDGSLDSKNLNQNHSFSQMQMDLVFSDLILLITSSDISNDDNNNSHSIMSTTFEKVDIKNYCLELMDLIFCFDKGEGSRNNFHIILGDIYSQIANAFTKQQNYHDAIEFAGKSLLIKVKTLGVNCDKVADSHHSLGILYKLYNDLDSSRSELSIGKDIRKRLHGELSLAVAKSDFSLCQVEMAAGNMDGAYLHSYNCHKIRLQLLGLTHVQTIAAKKLMQKACCQDGDRRVCMQELRSRLVGLTGPVAEVIGLLGDGDVMLESRLSVLVRDVLQKQSSVEDYNSVEKILLLLLPKDEQQEEQEQHEKEVSSESKLSLTPSLYSSGRYRRMKSPLASPSVVVVDSDEHDSPFLRRSQLVRDCNEESNYYNNNNSSGFLSPNFRPMVSPNLLKKKINNNNNSNKNVPKNNDSTSIHLSSAISAESNSTITTDSDAIIKLNFAIGDNLSMVAMDSNGLLLRISRWDEPASRHSLLLSPVNTNTVTNKPIGKIHTPKGFAALYSRMKDTDDNSNDNGSSNSENNNLTTTTVTKDKNHLVPYKQTNPPPPPPLPNSWPPVSNWFADTVIDNSSKKNETNIIIDKINVVDDESKQQQQQLNKLKQIHLISVESVDGTLWADDNETAKSVEMLEEVFDDVLDEFKIVDRKLASNRNGSIFITSSQAVESKKQLQSLIDPQRSQHINIMIARFGKLSIRDVMQNVYDLQVDTLGLSLLSTLQQCIPTTEESNRVTNRLAELRKKEIEDFKMEDTAIEKYFPRAEQFIIHVSKVQAYETRLSILSFIIHFPELSKEFIKSSDTILCAVHEVKGSVRFKFLLKTFLKLENILSNKPKSRKMKGFSIESLEKLNQIKSNSGETIEQYVVCKLWRLLQESVDLMSDMPSLESAKMVKFDRLLLDLKKMEEGIKQIKYLITITSNDSISNRNDISQLNIFLLKSEKAFETYSKKLKESINDFNELCLYLGIKGNNNNNNNNNNEPMASPDYLFGILLQFNKSIQNANNYAIVKFKRMARLAAMT